MAGWATGSSNEVWSVAQLTRYIRELFSIDFRLQDLSVSGEISNFTKARSGHLYFTLKDDASQLKCVMWRSGAERLDFDPQDGDAVIVTGKVSVYEASGAYQLYAEEMEQAGRGSLAVAFEQLRNQLESEGLFEPSHKQPIPRFPRKIGIVTSADAAALRDILNVLRRRYPVVSVLIAPTLVQGNQAPAQIVRSLQWLDGRNDIDTILLSRGGGSIEDLWAFNDEGVARAIYHAKHPIISGVGHEIDFTISDFVADLRAPTPSAAAELAVPDAEELTAVLQTLQQRLTSDMVDTITQYQLKTQSLSQSLQLLNPQRSVDNNRQRLDSLTIRLDNIMHRLLDRKRNQFERFVAELEAMSPLATLGRGYAMVRDENGRLLRSIKGLKAGTAVEIRLADGKIKAIIDHIDEDSES